MPTFDEIIKSPEFNAASPDVQFLVVKDLPELQGASPGAIKILLRDLPKLTITESSPFPEADQVNKFGDLTGVDQLATQHAPLLGLTAGSMMGPLSPVMGPVLAGVGSAYQQARGSLANQRTAIPSGRPSLSLNSPFPEANMMELLRASDINAGQVGKEMLIGKAAQVLGDRVLAPALGKILSPGAASIQKTIASDEIAKTAQEMAKEGFPIDPTTYAPSITGRVLTWMTDHFPFIRPINDSFRRKINESILQMRQDFVSDVLGVSDPSKALGAAEVEKNALFRAIAEKAGGPKVEVPIPNVAKAVEEATNHPGSMTDKWWQDNPIIQKIRNQSQSETTKLTPSTPDTLKLTIEDINSLYSKTMQNKGKDVYGKLSQVERNLRQSVRNAISEDFRAYDALYESELLPTAQKAWDASRDIHQLRNAKFIEGLLNEASKPMKEEYGKVFYPEVFNRLFRTKRDALMRNLGKEKFDLLDKFRERALAAVPDLNKLVNRPSQVEQLAVAATSMGALYAQPWLLMPMGFSGLMARSIMSPKGMMRSWLTNTVGPPRLVSRMTIESAISGDGSTNPSGPTQ